MTKSGPQLNSIRLCQSMRASRLLSRHTDALRPVGAHSKLQTTNVVRGAHRQLLVHKRVHTIHACTHADEASQVNANNKSGVTDANECSYASRLLLA